jgi:hypothetical protein
MRRVNTDLPRLIGSRNQSTEAGYSSTRFPHETPPHFAVPASWSGSTDHYRGGTALPPGIRYTVLPLHERLTSGASSLGLM